MSKAVIPTLDTTVPVLETTSDKLIYLLKFLMFNPGWTSSWYDEHLMSMRRDMAKYAENPSTLVPELQRYLNTAINKFYTDYTCKVTVTDTDPNSNTYSMLITIVDGAGVPVLSLDKVRKDESGVFVFNGV